MPDGGWTHDYSPFHRGEMEIQQRLGVRNLVEGVGRRVVRDYLPEQHRAFYAQLPFLVAGSVDHAGRPWASILAGRPGFAHSPDPRRLIVDTQPLYADPLAQNLDIGDDIGLLGIELSTRRRNRLNGRVSAADEHGFEISVQQSFGNCPQYIQTRAITIVSGQKFCRIAVKSFAKWLGKRGEFSGLFLPGKISLFEGILR